MKKIDLHVHTKSTASDRPFVFSSGRLNDYVRVRQLDCIATTNHNEFDLSQFEEIRKIVDISVLPGIEVDVEGGQLLLIGDGSDTREFDSRCKRISKRSPNKRDSISVNELKEVFGDLSKYILIPHYDKKPETKAETLLALGSYVTAGEVTSPKKFMYCIRSKDKLVPVYFSDCRIEDTSAEFPIRQTYVACEEATFAAIKSCLRDKRKVALSARDGNRVFQIFEDGQLLSTGLNVILGKRSSGKSHTLTEVNEAIQKTLREKSAEDFWWLNNGVTIVATRASLSAKALTIEDPQIVNGLQSSSEIFNYYTTANTRNDNRKMLVRVIVPSDAASRDRIIKATNSQTAVQPASLRATDKIHRDIEEYLKPRGLFYDRRKNFYKNEGKPLDRIIGIPQLAQATMALVLAKPDQARARPSSLLKDDKNYAQVYSPDYPIGVYHVCAAVLKRVEASLRSSGLEVRQQNNLKFYIAMHATYLLAKKWKPTPKELADLDVGQLDEATMQKSFGVVRQHYSDLGSSDQVAKGSELLDGLHAKFPN